MHALLQILIVGMCVICAEPIRATDNRGILINEVWTGAPDWIELANPTMNTIDVSGWRLRMWSKSIEQAPWINEDIIIPEGTVIPPFGFFILSDALSNGGISEIILTAMEGFACVLETRTGNPIDSVVAGGIFGVPNLVLSEPALFAPPFPLRNRENGLFRTSWTDQDSGGDWVVSEFSTPGGPNPGQSERSDPCLNSDKRIGVSPETDDAILLPEFRSGFTSRHVIILVLDGVRVSDVFDPGVTDRFPNISDWLAVQGTLDTECVNTGNTVTLPGHVAMTTGRWLMQGNNKYPIANIGPESPTMFEYYRKNLENLGIPLIESSDRCVQLYGKYEECSAMASSYHPLYGPDYGSVIRFPEMELNWPDEAPHKDMIVYRAALQELRDRQPDLMLVNLAQIDQRGHHGGWDGYEYSLRKADELASGIWREIQSQPYYRDSTTLIVTTDHGRHDDAHGGYHHHGCNCRGCRRIFCLVLGPDTPAGVRLDEPFETIDIPATVATLMGFDAPLCEGRFMAGMFVPSESGSESAALSQVRDVSISANTDQVAVTWLAQSDVGWTGMFSRSASNVSIWSYPMALPFQPQGHITRWVTCALTPEGALITAIASHPQPSVEPDTLSWHLNVLDQDLGRSILVARTGKMGNYPAVMQWDGSINTIWSRYYDQPEPFPPYHSSIQMAIEDEPESIPRFAQIDSGLFVPGPPSFVQEHDLIHCVFRNHENNAWTIRYCRSDDAGLSWVRSGALLPVDMDRQINDPAIGHLAGTVHIVWPETTLPDGRWSIQCASSFNNGVNWTAPIALSDSVGQSVDPLIIAEDGRIIVAWVAINQGQCAIQGRISSNGGTSFGAIHTWVDFSSSLIQRPRAVRVENDLMLAWIDAEPRVDHPLNVTRIAGLFP